MKEVEWVENTADPGKVFQGSGTRTYAQHDADGDAESPPGQDRIGGDWQTGMSAGDARR
jgi:hypothetical protein